MKNVAIVFSAVIALGQAQQTPSTLPATPTYHLYFLGHEIGRETDVVAATPAGRRLDAAFEFVDRGTTVSLTGRLDVANDGSAVHFAVKGRNYRLFTSDSEVSVTAGRAHVRDLGVESDVAVRGPFFPADNYAPIGAQEELIRYWFAHGRPAEIEAPPAGRIRISLRGALMPPGATPASVVASGTTWRLAIEGLVWGTETAWFDQTRNRLLGVVSWAGALPFEAILDTHESELGEYLRQANADRIADAERLSKAAPPIQSDTFALVGARVLAGADMAPIENATLVVRDGRIAEFGQGVALPVPGRVPVIDARGKTIVPGLWDMHAHASQIDWAPVYLASGVTTIRDMGGEEAFLIAIRDAIKSGRALGPQYLLAGLVDGPGPRAFGAVTAATPDEGRAVVRRYHDEHFDQIKIYSLVTPDVVNAIVDEAHKLGMTVTGHVPNGMTSQSVVEAGFDQIAHMQLRGASGSDASKQQIAFFKSHNTVMDPTESWNELSGRPSATPLDVLLPGVSRLPRPLARMFASMNAGNGDPQAAHARLIDTVKLLKDAVDAGLLVVAGTDKGVPGFSLQRELELYVEGGMTPVQALQTATIMPALAMGLARDVGTIEGGKRADFVVLDENPLEKMSNIRTARMVSANGRLYDCEVLWRAAGYAPRLGKD